MQSQLTSCRIALAHARSLGVRVRFGGEILQHLWNRNEWWIQTKNIYLLQTDTRIHYFPLFYVCSFFSSAICLLHANYGLGAVDCKLTDTHFIRLWPMVGWMAEYIAHPQLVIATHWWCDVNKWLKATTTVYTSPVYILWYCSPKMWFVLASRFTGILQE